MLSSLSIAGVDEVGRGALVGPVIAAAVILDLRNPISGLIDSKTLSPRRREALAEEIRKKALAWAIGRAEKSEIDRLDIHQATLLAMRRAVLGLEIEPEEVLVDGRFVPDLPMPTRAVVRGDRKVEAIAAASILAKVFRDREMVFLDAFAPSWGIVDHKGYPTASHLQQLQAQGPSPWHRMSFRPCRTASSTSASTADMP